MFVARGALKPHVVFETLIALGVVWTGVWATALSRSRRTTIPFAQVRQNRYDAHPPRASTSPVSGEPRSWKPTEQRRALELRHTRTGALTDESRATGIRRYCCAARLALGTSGVDHHPINRLYDVDPAQLPKGGFQCEPLSSGMLLCPAAAGSRFHVKPRLTAFTTMRHCGRDDASVFLAGGPPSTRRRGRALGPERLSR